MRDNGRHVGALADFYGNRDRVVGVEALTRAFQAVREDCTVRAESTPLAYEYCRPPGSEPIPKTPCAPSDAQARSVRVTRTDLTATRHRSGRGRDTGHGGSPVPDPSPADRLLICLERSAC